MEQLANMETLKQDKLQMRVRESILGGIKNGAFADGRLPTEGKLAEMLGVSRATISITLAYLEKEGIVVRRHGSATYVNLGYNDIHSRIDQGIGVYDLIKQNNYEPSLISNTLKTIPAEELSDKVLSALKLEAGDPVHCITRVFGAGGAPAILTEEYLPAKYMTVPLDIHRLPQTIYQLSEQYFTAPIEFTMVEIIPCLVNDYLAEHLRCSVREPILLTEEIHLNNHSSPIIFSRVYVLDKYIRFQAIRTRQ